MTKHQLTIDLPLEGGGVLQGARIVFHESEGRCGRTIWICHALTANSNPEDWWPEMVGPGRCIDTLKDHVVCVNMLGSAYGSEGPARTNPATGEPWLLDFPMITIRDSVNAFIEVRKHLGIGKIDLLIGASNGGFNAIEWAIMEPDVFGRCLFLCTAPRISPFLGATVEAQRMAWRPIPASAKPAAWKAARKASSAPGPRPSSATVASGATASPRRKKTPTPSLPAAWPPMNVTRVKNWSAGALTPTPTSPSATPWTATTQDAGAGE
ncbi:MAG: alpha/beta fold hydrolase [Bacteroidales bacterium]|nr:alpha/beta fold hydrolase [Bacteroidales bacterium]